MLSTELRKDRKSVLCIWEWHGECRHHAGVYTDRSVVAAERRPEGYKKRAAPGAALNRMCALDGRLRNIPSTPSFELRIVVGQPETWSYRRSRSFDSCSHVEEVAIVVAGGRFTTPRDRSQHA